jgi:hypothetical protein
MTVADENELQFFGHLSKKEKDEMIKLLYGIVSKNQLKEIP